MRVAAASGAASVSAQQASQAAGDTERMAARARLFPEVAQSKPCFSRQGCSSQASCTHSMTLSPVCRSSGDDTTTHTGSSRAAHRCCSLDASTATLSKYTRKASSSARVATPRRYMRSASASAEPLALASRRASRVLPSSCNTASARAGGRSRKRTASRADFASTVSRRPSTTSTAYLGCGRVRQRG